MVCNEKTCSAVDRWNGGILQCLDAPADIRCWSAEVEQLCRYSQRSKAVPDWTSFQAPVVPVAVAVGPRVTFEAELSKVLKPWVAWYKKPDC